MWRGLLRIKWFHILAPTAVGACTALTTGASDWAEHSPALTSVVSIVATGILVRLSRGVPFASIDVLPADEARKLSAALKTSAHQLWALLLACAFTIFCLVFIEPMEGLLGFLEPFDGVAFLVPFLLIFVLLRIHEVVANDVQITEIQADILLKKRNEAAADAFERDVIVPTRQNYRPPSNYGRVIEKDSL